MRIVHMSKRGPWKELGRKWGGTWSIIGVNWEGTGKELGRN